jgi:hypothetical protein
MRFSVVVLRRNGRFLREVPARSRYHAKLLRRQLEGKYDLTHRVEIRSEEGRPEMEEEWMAALDLADHPKPFFKGSEEGAKKAAREHEKSEWAYVIAPDGSEWDFNESLNIWEEI